MFRKIHLIFRRIAAGLMLGIVFTACAPAAKPIQRPTSDPAATFSGQLTPYVLPSITTTSTPTLLVTPTPLPSFTPTPLTHVVKKGEDMGGIAYQYRVTVPDLMAANPKVNPHAMSIGTLLIIPPSKTQMPTVAAKTSALPPSLTPIPVETGAMHCAQDQTLGIWCFLPVRNNQAFTLEGISAIFKLASADGNTSISQTASLPLDLLPPGETLPLAAYFPPAQAQGLTVPFQASSELRTALTSADNGRYLPTQMDNQKVMISADGLSAAITLNVRLKDLHGRAQRLWVAAFAYDNQGQVVGMRRWENASGQLLQNGTALSVAMNVYSVDGRIDKVSLMAEARP